MPKVGKKHYPYTKEGYKAAAAAKKMRIVAESLVKEAIDGNVGAISLISDRLDGKAKVEAEIMTHHTGEPLKTITLNIIDPNEKPSDDKIIEHEP